VPDGRTLIVGGETSVIAIFDLSVNEYLLFVKQFSIQNVLFFKLIRSIVAHAADQGRAEQHGPGVLRAGDQSGRQVVLLVLRRGLDRRLGHPQPIHDQVFMHIACIQSHHTWMWGGVGPP